MDDVDTVAQELLKKDPNSFDGHRLLASAAYVKPGRLIRVAQTEAGKEFLQDRDSRNFERPTPPSRDSFLSAWLWRKS